MSKLLTDHWRMPLLKANNITLETGRTVITAGAKALIEERYPGQYDNVTNLVMTKHIIGDWSEMVKSDALENLKDAYTGEGRVFSQFRLPQSETDGTEAPPRVWVITEWDRSYTTVLLPEEY